MGSSVTSCIADAASHASDDELKKVVDGLSPASKSKIRAAIPAVGKTTYKPYFAPEKILSRWCTCFCSPAAGMGPRASRSRSIAGPSTMTCLCTGTHGRTRDVIPPDVIAKRDDSSRLVARYTDAANALKIPVKPEAIQQDCDLIIKLLQYAEDQVKEARAEMEAGFVKFGLWDRKSRLKVDLALPGAGYFSVAGGGLAEVLYHLSDIVELDRGVGASGGACSIFLILADAHISSVVVDPTTTGSLSCSRTPTTQERIMYSSETLLMMYLLYGRDQSRGAGNTLNALGQAFSSMASFWEHAYTFLLNRDPINDKADTLAMNALKEKGFVAVVPTANAKPGDGPRAFPHVSSNFIFYNFRTVEQIVKAYVATGEASPFGFMKGVPVLTTDEATEQHPTRSLYQRERSCPDSFCIPQRFRDGGSAVPLNSIPRRTSDGSERETALLYYATFFNEVNYVAMVSQRSVETLFKRGVDEAIDLFKFKTHQFSKDANPQLYVSSGGKMVLAVSGVNANDGHVVQQALSQDKKCKGWLQDRATFVDLHDNDIFEF